MPGLSAGRRVASSEERPPGPATGRADGRDYDDVLAYLYGLEARRGWDLKLERVRRALVRLGSPERAYPSLLVAGTNGKGSTAALVHAALSAAGRRVGLFTSPHLVHFAERIRIGDAEISPAEVVAGVERIRAVAPPEETGLTFFEMATLLALLAFAERGVDAAVLEVGLGGRLDATNAVEPLASAIVSIGLDHEDYLGSGLASIAREKAGVMRPGRATVLGADLRPEAAAALEAVAGRTGARLVRAAADPGPEVELALAGAHMRRNAAVAGALLEELAAVEPGLRVSPEERRRGFASVRWPGRLAVVGRDPLVLCDGAHNREAVEALLAALPGVCGARRPGLVFGALADKPWREMAARLAEVAAEVVVVPVPHPRAVAPEVVATAFPPGRVSVHPASSAEAVLELTRRDAGRPILVTGSLFLVGSLYADLLARSGGSSVFADLRGAAA